MAEKKYQVFISSTYSDLKEERRKILDILLMADCIPAGMEAFVASDVEQFEVIKKVIELCDYYILIIGKRYGSINEQTGLSYTEMEYDYAKELGLPVLVFSLDESVALPPEKMEDNPERIAALQRFREKALTNRLATIWKTEVELTNAVVISVLKAKTDIPRPGWQRATDYDEASLRRQIMDLQKQNIQLQEGLDDAKKKLKEFAEVNDVAFEDCELEIPYFFNPGSSYSPRSGITKVTFPEVFRIVATQMMDVALTEKGIEIALRQNLYGENSYSYTFADPQLIKKVMNQFKVLKLVTSSWSAEKENLFWELTAKGVHVRNEMIVVKTKEIE